MADYRDIDPDEWTLAEVRAFARDWIGKPTGAQAAEALKHAEDEGFYDPETKRFNWDS